MQTELLLYFKDVYTPKTMGIARKLKITRGSNFVNQEACAVVGDAINDFANEAREQESVTPSTLDSLYASFIKMLCLPLCGKTHLDQAVIDNSVSLIASGTNTTSIDIADMLVEDMYCNLCPPWPLCPPSLSFCVRESLIEAEMAEAT